MQLMRTKIVNLIAGTKECCPQLIFGTRTEQLRIVARTVVVSTEAEDRLVHPPRALNPRGRARHVPRRGVKALIRRIRELSIVTNVVLTDGRDEGISSSHPDFNHGHRCTATESDSRTRERCTSADVVNHKN